MSQQRPHPIRSAPATPSPPPRLIFLAVRPEQRQLTNPIANALCDRIHATTGWAFQYPLYKAVAGMFYLCDPTFDMGMAHAEVPYEPRDAWLFYPKFEAVMREHFGDDIIRRMAWDYVRENVDYFDYLIFTDAFGRHEDANYLAERVGRDRCAAVHINGDPNAPYPFKMRNLVEAVGPDYDSIMDNLADRLVVEPELPLEMAAPAAARP